jgi:predicted permease
LFFEEDMTAFLQDTRYAFRTLLHNPGFTAVAVLSLALGIGANTAIFGLIDAVMLRTLPVEKPGELVYFGEGDYRGISFSTLPLFRAVSYPMLRAYQRELQSFTGVAAHDSRLNRVYISDATNVSGGSPEAATAQLVSGNYFGVLGIRPSLGRLLEPNDDVDAGAHPVVVLSYGFWQQKFGGDAEIAGKTMLINGRAYTVLGVTPPNFFGERVGERPDLWAPLVMQAEISQRGSFLDDAHVYWMRAFGRLKPGVSLQQARAEVDVVFQQQIYDLAGDNMSQQERERTKQLRAVLAPAAHGLSNMRQNYANPLILLMSVVGLVLLIACANIANLLLARATARRKEIGVRLALGAGRARLVRQLLTESLLLSAAGGLLAVLVGSWALELLLRMASRDATPVPLDAGIDLRVLAFTSGLTLLTVLLFGLVPALRATRFDLAPTLQVNARGGIGERSRFGLNRALVVSQVAMSLVLLIGAGLFLRSLQNLRNIAWGFDTSHVLVVGIDPRGAGIEREQLAPLYQRLLERVEAIPGVQSASISLYSLLGGSTRSGGIEVEGYTFAEGEDADTEQIEVTSRYFETVGMRILEGRGFTDPDRAGSPLVAVVNRKFAERFFPNRSALGGQISTGGDAGGKYEIVGVVEDSRIHSPGEDPNIVMFFPVTARADYLSSLDVRSTADPAALAAALRAALAETAPNLPVTEILTMDDRVDRVLTQQRLMTQLTGAFGLLALLLATLGLYGLMSYNVSRRTSEIGIRMALGAERTNVLGLVLKESMVLVGAGAIVGLVGAAMLARLLTSQLYETSATDPAAMVVATVVLLLVAALAAYLPARRAARTDPMTALRYE